MQTESAAVQSYPTMPHGAVYLQAGMVLSAKWRSPMAVGCGLQNLGNSCYLNSALQCLAHIPPLANLCLARVHSSSCKMQQGQCICCHVENLFCRMLQRNAPGADAPLALHRNLHVLNRNFVKGRQEDAHELLRCLVDAMERNLLKQAGNYNPHKPPKQPHTPVNAVFGGILQSQVRCLHCGHASNSWDPFMDLSLELGGCSSVEDALGRFTAVEKLDGDNKYKCDGCKQLVPAHKQITIYDDPNVLVVHLKRFDGIFGAKISREITFHTTLDLEAYMCPSIRTHTSCSGSSSSSCSSCIKNNGVFNGFANSSSSSGGSHWQHSIGAMSKQQQQQQQRQQAVNSRTTPGKYLLHGVLIHQGYNANSGHYYAYVRDGQPPHGYWHCMNDAQVYRVAENTVLKQMAYILFYVRTHVKQQAHLPQQHTPSQPAVAAAGPQRPKRSSSEANQPGVMIGPQLPPDLQQKRQRLDVPQPSAVQGQHVQRPANLPQQQWLTQQQHQQQLNGHLPANGVSDSADSIEAGAAVVYGPQLPPWYGSKRRSSCDGAIGSNSSAAATAAGSAASAPGAVAAVDIGSASSVIGNGHVQQARSRSRSSGVGPGGGTGSVPAITGAQQQQQQHSQHQHGQTASSSQQTAPPDNSWQRPDYANSADAPTVCQPLGAQARFAQKQATAAVAAAAAGHTAAGNRSAATGAPAAAGEDVGAFRQHVEAELWKCGSQVKPWLACQLSAAKLRGISRQQSKLDLLSRLTQHPAIQGTAQQLFQQYLTRYVPSWDFAATQGG